MRPLNPHRCPSREQRQDRPSARLERCLRAGVKTEGPPRPSLVVDQTNDPPSLGPSSILWASLLQLGKQASGSLKTAADRSSIIQGRGI